MNPYNLTPLDLWAISIIQRGKASKLLTIWLTPKNIQVQSKRQGAQVRQVPFPKDKKI